MSDRTTGEVGGPRPVKTATEARQGATGHNVRYVLLFGLIAIIVVFAIAGFTFFKT